MRPFSRGDLPRFWCRKPARGSMARFPHTAKTEFILCSSRHPVVSRRIKLGGYQGCFLNAPAGWPFSGEGVLDCGTNDLRSSKNESYGGDTPDEIEHCGWTGRCSIRHGLRRRVPYACASSCSCSQGSLQIGQRVACRRPVSRSRAVFQIPIIDLCYSSPADDVDAAELPAAKFPSKRLRRTLAPNLGTIA